MSRKPTKPAPIPPPAATSRSYPAEGGRSYRDPRTGATRSRPIDDTPADAAGQHKEA